jgi:integrase/recombinase XerD
MSDLRAFAKAHGCRMLSQLDVTQLRRYRAGWTEGPLTAVKKLERVRSFFRFCLESKWIDENPARALKMPRVPTKPTLPFTPAEIRRILAACDEYPRNNSQGYDNRARMKTLVLLMRYSGLRISDAINLERSRLAGGKLLLYTAKTGQPVFVPLPHT